MDLISNITIECEKNNIFLTSNVTLTLNDEIVVAGIQNITMEGQKVKILSAEEYAKRQGKEVLL